jgi:large subunit ribosomal protein L15
MKLHEIPKIKAATHRRKRLGAGKGSGRGKTAGRGHKGQHARSGASIHPSFEGGQMPLYRKLPHRGFNNIFRTDYEIINLGELSKLKAKVVDRDVLLKAGIVANNKKPLKVLGHGEISSAITITADKFSSSAVTKIKAAGGKVIIIEQKESALKKPARKEDKSN